MNTTTKIVISSVGFVVVLVLFLIFNSFVIISAGERGVVLNFGAVSEKVLNEGLSWRIPIVQKIIKVDVRIQKKEAEASGASKDLQEVAATVALNFHLLPEKVNKVWQSVGKDYQERLIIPAIQESVKATTAKFTAEELITKREQVKEQIKQNLIDRLEPRYIVIDEMNITSFEFSEAFDTAIEAKVTAEQLKLKAEMDLQRIRVEAEQAVAEAIGKAEAIQIEAKALRENAQVVELRWIEKWNGQVPQYWGAATPFIGIDR